MTGHSKDFRVAIVGGGMCGLVCAIGLIKAGIHAEIFEQASSFREVGAGVTLGPNALFPLKELGVLPAVLSKSEENEPTSQAFRYISATGTHNLIYDYPTYPDDIGARIYRNAWPSFLEAIVPMLDPRLVHMEKRCISLSTLPAGSYVLHFADGSTYESDLVIGADGIKSVIRDFVTGRPVSLAYSNSVAYRSVIPSEAFKNVKTDMIRPLCWIGKDKLSTIKHIISYPVQANQKVCSFYISKLVISNPEKMNLVFFSTNPTVPIGSVDVPLPWAKPVSQDELLHEFSQAEWGEDANTILKEMKNISKWYLHFLHPPLSTYTRQRVVLVGDAAHAMLPYLGSGAGQGFEDVYALCHLLGDVRAQKCHLNDALQAYDSIRVVRASMVQSLSTLMGNIVEQRGPGGGTIAEIREQLRDIYHPIWHHDLKGEVERAVASVYGKRGVL